MPTALKKLNFFLKVKKLKKPPKSTIVSVVKNKSFIKDTIHFLPFWENGVKFFTIEGPNKEKVEFSQYL